MPVPSGGREPYDLLFEAAGGDQRVFIATCIRAPEGGMCTLGTKAILAEPDVLKLSCGVPEVDQRLLEAALALRAGKEGAHVDLGVDGAFFLERVLRRTHLVIAGRGHVGLAVAHLAKAVGFRVTFVDERPEVAPSEPVSPYEHFVQCDYVRPFEGLAHIEDAYCIIVTHKHRGDQDVLRAALGQSFAYVGMIGSRRKIRLIKENLQEEGIARERLDAVYTPIGINLGGQSPEEIALSVVAEITALRNGVPLGDIRPMKALADCGEAT